MQCMNIEQNNKALISCLGEKERKNMSEGKKKRKKKDRAFARPCVKFSYTNALS